MRRSSWARRGTAVVASLAITLLAGTATTAHADSPNGRIINHGTGRCLATDGGQQALAAVCDETDSYQQFWTVDRRDDGTVRIQTVMDGKCLSSYIEGGVSVDDCAEGTTAPVWVMRDGGKFANIGGDEWCLTVSGGDLVTAACDSGYNRYQDWVLPVDSRS
ncbi:ricin-type beta-trefoil lectin domain protein [Kitasatospora sp. NPDC056181]|uniref:ricin-type beta-trefoil lectin domain protein n=1 Tax=Kitasatospora sp. NPDC056181 TaxID=3345737 RepID=UPI0035D7D229